MTLELEATPEAVMRAVEKLQAFGQQLDIPEKEMFGLALALEECGSNIVNHALQRDSRRKFRVTIENRAGTITVELRDDGPEFDPTRERPAQGATVEDDRAPGGWGIELTRRFVDGLTYRREAGENILLLTKVVKRESNQD